MNAWKFFSKNHSDINEGKSPSPSPSFKDVELANFVGATHITGSEISSNVSGEGASSTFDITKCFDPVIENIPEDSAANHGGMFEGSAGEQQIYIYLALEGDKRFKYAGTDARYHRVYIYRLDTSELYEDDGQSGKAGGHTFDFGEGDYYKKTNIQSGGGGAKKPAFKCTRFKITINIEPGVSEPVEVPAGLGYLSGSLVPAKPLIPQTNRELILLSDSLQGGFNDYGFLNQHPNSEINNLIYYTDEISNEEKINIKQNFNVVSHINVAGIRDDRGAGNLYDLQAYQTSSIDSQICSAPNQVSVGFSLTDINKSSTKLGNTVWSSAEALASDSINYLNTSFTQSGKVGYTYYIVSWDDTENNYSSPINFLDDIPETVDGLQKKREKDLYIFKDIEDKITHIYSTAGIKTIKAVVFSFTTKNFRQIVRRKFVTTRLFLDLPASAYPDFEQLSANDFTTIPWPEPAAMIGGISNKSKYKNSVQDSLSSGNISDSDILDERLLVNDLENNELGLSIEEFELEQVRYFSNGEFDMHKLLGIGEDITDPILPLPGCEHIPGSLCSDIVYSDWDYLENMCNACDCTFSVYQGEDKCSYDLGFQCRDIGGWDYSSNPQEPISFGTDIGIDQCNDCGCGWNFGNYNLGSEDQQQYPDGYFMPNCNYTSGKECNSIIDEQECKDCATYNSEQSPNFYFGCRWLIPQPETGCPSDYHNTDCSYITDDGIDDTNSEYCTTTTCINRCNNCGTDCFHTEQYTTIVLDSESTKAYVGLQSKGTFFVPFKRFHGPGGPAWGEPSENQFGGNQPDDNLLPPDGDSWIPSDNNSNDDLFEYLYQLQYFIDDGPISGGYFFTEDECVTAADNRCRIFGHCTSQCIKIDIQDRRNAIPNDWMSECEDKIQAEGNNAGGFGTQNASGKCACEWATGRDALEFYDAQLVSEIFTQGQYPLTVDGFSIRICKTSNEDVFEEVNTSYCSGGNTWEKDLTPHCAGVIGNSTGDIPDKVPAKCGSDVNDVVDINTPPTCGPENNAVGGIYGDWTPYTDNEEINGRWSCSDWNLNRNQCFPDESSVGQIFINDILDLNIIKQCKLEFNCGILDNKVTFDSSGNTNKGILIGDYKVKKNAKGKPLTRDAYVRTPIRKTNKDGAL